MEIINSQEKQNLLLDRREVRIDAEADITPSRSEAIKAVVKTFSCPEEVINIIRVDGSFGTKGFTIVADIYGSKEAKALIAIKRKKEFEAEKKVDEEKKKVEEEKRKAEEEKNKPVEQPAEAPDQVDLKEGVSSEKVGEEKKE